MERLKTIKEELVTQVMTQMNDLSCVDTEELGEVIDMIKDITKSMYYCKVISAMEEEPHKKKDEWSGGTDSYQQSSNRNNQKNLQYKSIKESNMSIEEYMQHLTKDMIDYIEQITPEEKSIIQRKINVLAAKIQNI